jgi:hypothetical protein
MRPVQVYQRLYAVRNQSLHGGSIDQFLIRGRYDDRPGRGEEPPLQEPELSPFEWNDLRWAVPALYRAVLLGFLAENSFHQYPPVEEPENLDEYSKYVDMREGYEDYERPIVRRCRRG